MRLTERDILLFKWINGHGFVTADQINRFLSVAKTTGYRRIKKLVDHGYIKREKILHSAGAAHFITKQAKDACGDNLEILKKISLGGYIHDLALVDLSLDLEKNYQANFISERRLRLWGGIGGVGVEGHMPDGILELSNGKKWAIELELSVKAASRLDKIMRFYNCNFDYNEVHYFMSDQVVKNAVQKSIESSGACHVKTHMMPKKTLEK